ncbi:translation elongation factor Ts [Bacteriovorax stolpii]|uniref:Elongation factor Ts n=1 Tax=Bacteriovorax stolpii TaxID=960 RepID=A0A2K9NMK8_BACTC|nr:translation elongation factor Ts [Bacteriovorax stolpii]AUN96749.1 elongation factor Ts [Bacteriovorax stolpii]QDK43320.1 translation elongation factor Ts [Bacteriovorax stolpii]TDP53024.1 translation elongation factor Ts (EF-Ts) [Bacteriovorax stolpii]BDT26775.1 translation elongation factor Ts [Bacteriovorax sp. HI3]
MTQITAKLVSELREKTGAGMMDCKKALGETNGDLEKAIDYLRQKGLAAAQKKQSRIAAEGAIGSYIHGGRIGVMVEINCETDFVAKSDDFQNFVKDVAMHIAAADPKFVRSSEMDQAFVEREIAIYTAQLKEEGKPEAMISKIVEGKVKKLSTEVCLLDQKFIKNPDISVQDLINELTIKIGEKIDVRRFAKFTLGEGIEKKVDDFAAEVASMTGGKQ